MTIVLVILALLGGGVFVLKPKWLHGQTKRAEAAKDATAKVEETTAKVDAAVEAQGASAAAGVVAIGRANSEAPESPAKNFIGQEVPAVLAKLPAPDPMALLEAEKRRSAVMEGRAAEARALYEVEAKKAATLQAERDKAIAERNAAQEQQRQANAAIAEAAAAARAQERQQAIAIVVIVLLVGLWAYTKLFSISPASLGRMAADVRAGVPPIQALDVHLAPWLHSRVSKSAKLASELKDP